MRKYLQAHDGSGFKLGIVKLACGRQAYGVKVKVSGVSFGDGDYASQALHETKSECRGESNQKYNQETTATFGSKRLCTAGTVLSALHSKMQF